MRSRGRIFLQCCVIIMAAAELVVPRSANAAPRSCGDFFCEFPVQGTCTTGQTPPPNLSCSGCGPPICLDNGPDCDSPQIEWVCSFAS